ncbi:hypothetical protein QBC44DRAFT_312290 [Cladorrhinum sp. PSN332]|nr:hypothetical protein QBC44DRAFT_312290 [Cladorrhinum sp. PSN332]
MCKFLAYQHKKCGRMSAKERQPQSCAKGPYILGHCAENDDDTKTITVAGYCNEIQGPSPCEVCLGQAKAAYVNKGRISNAIEQGIQSGDTHLAMSILRSPGTPNLITAGMRYENMLKEQAKEPTLQEVAAQRSLAQIDNFSSMMYGPGSLHTLRSDAERVGRRFEEVVPDSRVRENRHDTFAKAMWGANRRGHFLLEVFGSGGEYEKALKTMREERAEDQQANIDRVDSFIPGEFRRQARVATASEHGSAISRPVQANGFPSLPMNSHGLSSQQHGFPLPTAGKPDAQHRVPKTES